MRPGQGLLREGVENRPRIVRENIEHEARMAELADRLLDHFLAAAERKVAHAPRPISSTSRGRERPDEARPQRRQLAAILPEGREGEMKKIAFLILLTILLVCLG